MAQPEAQAGNVMTKLNNFSLATESFPNPQYSPRHLDSAPSAEAPTAGWTSSAYPVLQLWHLVWSVSQTQVKQPVGQPASIQHSRGNMI